MDRSSFQNANWKSRREKLDFYDFPFWVIHYQLVEEGGNDGSGNLQEDTGGEEKGRDGELDIQGGFFNWSALKMTKCHTLRKF